MTRVVHFELSADDPQRALAFYQAVFGWEGTRWDGPVDYWLLTTGPEQQPGINGAIYRRDTPNPAGAEPGNGTRITVEVQNLEQTLAAVEAHGGRITAPPMAVPGVGYAARFLDPEGNETGLMQPDPQAG